MGKQELKLKPSILSNNLAEQVANEELKKTENFDTLKTFYRNLMHQLEMDGIEKIKISTVGKKIVLEKKRAIKKEEGASEEEIKNLSIGTWWFIVAKEENNIDPFYSHGEDASQLKRGNSSLSEIEEENYECINLIYDTITFLKDIALPKLKENNFISLLDNTNNKVALAFHDWRSHLDMAQSFFDHKEKIPVNTQHILLHAIGTYSSNNEAAEEYFKLRDNAHKLTGKQISKYRSGQIKTKLDIFNPQNRTTAILWNYFGAQCTKCNSWKVLKIKILNNVKCMDCDNIFEAKTISRCNYCRFPYFEEEIDYVKKERSCPNCKEELPEYLINNIIK